VIPKAVERVHDDGSHVAGCTALEQSLESSNGGHFELGDVSSIRHAVGERPVSGDRESVETVRDRRASAAEHGGEVGSHGYECRGSSGERAGTEAVAIESSPGTSLPSS
jgi:hypothetical protein